jgi:hypothetical protein
MLVFRATASLRARSTTLSSMLSANLVAAIETPFMRIVFADIIHNRRSAVKCTVWSTKFGREIGKIQIRAEANSRKLHNFSIRTAGSRSD